MYTISGQIAFTIIIKFMMAQNDYLSIKREIGVEKNSKVKSAQAWAVEGWVTSWDEGNQGGEHLHG